MRKSRVRSVVRWCLALVLPVTAFPVDGWARGDGGAHAHRTSLFALVVGSNAPGDTGLAPLHYADDDAVRNAELLRELGAEVVLLVRPDAETAALHPQLSARPATRASVQAAFDSLNLRMGQARARGEAPVLYLFLSGHGDVKNQQGYVVLDQDQLWRNELIALLRKSQAVTNHVIIDACKSYYMAFERGPGGVREQVRGLLGPDEPELPANTGVFLSASSARESHEWEAFQAGVFSHELRSALRGGADLDANGVVTYQEAASFVWAANRSIPNQRFRPVFFARPPRGTTESTAPLVSLHEAHGDRLVVGPGLREHLFVEDAAGVRIADFHPPGDGTVVLVLPRHRPLFLRKAQSPEQEVTLPPGPRMEVASLSWQRSGVHARGAEHVAFQMLFERPYDKKALDDYCRRSFETLPAEQSVPSRGGWVRHGIGLGAATLLIAGGTLTGLAWRERSSVEASTSGADRERSNRAIDHMNTAAVSCYVAAGALAVGYLTWTLWPEGDVAVGVGPADQVALRVSVGLP